MHTVIRAMLAPDPAERPSASRVLKVVQRLRALGAEGSPPEGGGAPAPAGGAAPAAAEAGARAAGARAAGGAADASVASPPTPPDLSAGFSADFGSASFSADFADDGAFAALASPQPALTSPAVPRVVRLELLHAAGGALRVRVTPLPLPGPGPARWEAAGAPGAAAAEPPAFASSTSFSAAFDADFGAPPPAPPAEREAEGVPRGPSDDFGDFEGAEGNDFGDFEGAAPAESGEPAAAPRRGSVPFSAELD